MHVTERCPEVATTYSAHLIYRSFGGQRCVETNHIMQISSATMLGTSKCMRPSVAPAARPQSRRSVMVAAHQVIANSFSARTQTNTSSGSRAVASQTIADQYALMSATPIPILEAVSWHALAPEMLLTQLITISWVPAEAARGHHEGGFDRRRGRPAHARRYHPHLRSELPTFALLVEMPVPPCSAAALRD